jgi:cytoskeletal protein RodZ
MADIGSTLREARIRARIDITEVEVRTKIRAKYLRAIENEEWDLLPGPVYVKSFLRTYGDFLGLDSRMLVDEYKRRYERPSDHELRPISSLHRERERAARGPLIPPWLLVAGVLAVVVVALLLISNRSGNSPSPSTTSAHSGVSTHDRPAPTHHLKPRAPVPTTVRLQLVPTAPVYVCLVNQAGDKLINEQTFSPGEQIPTETAPKLLLTLGNASVTMKVNGRGIRVTPSPNPIRVLIEPTHIRAIPMSMSPTCP